MQIFLYLAVLLASATSFSSSYLNYLYKTYVAELSIRWNELLGRCNTKGSFEMLDSELCYMLTRIIKPIRLLHIGGCDVVDFWLLSALFENRRSDNTTGSLITVDLSSDRVTDEKISDGKPIDIINRAHIAGRPLSEALKNVDLRGSFDLIVISDELSVADNEVMTQYLELLMQERDIALPAIHIAFPIAVINNASSTGGVQSSSFFLKWLKRKRAQYGFNLDPPSSKQNAVRQLFSSLLVHNSSSSASAMGRLIVASITPTPRVTLITPCSRPSMLMKAYKSINFNMITEWIIVYSYKLSFIIRRFNKQSHPKITELHTRNMTGNYGNPERNLALDSIPAGRRGWVYFLDDDNVVHRNMWGVMQRTPLSRIVLVANTRTNRGLIFEPQCKRMWVDSSMLLVSRELIDYYNTTSSYRDGRPRHKVRVRWDLRRHDADGLFAEKLCAYHKASLVVKIPYVASYHNAQRMNTSMMVEQPFSDRDMDRWKGHQRSFDDLCWSAIYFGLTLLDYFTNMFINSMYFFQLAR